MRKIKRKQKIPDSLCIDIGAKNVLYGSMLLTPPNSVLNGLANKKNYRLAFAQFVHQDYDHIRLNLFDNCYEPKFFVFVAIHNTLDKAN